MAIWGAHLDDRLNYDEGVYAASEMLLADGVPLVTGVFTSQPPLFLFMFEPFWELGGVVGVRVAVAVTALFALFALWLIALRLVGRPAAGLVVLLTALLPPFHNVAVAFQAEMPALALALWSIWLASVASGSRSGMVIVACLAGAAFGAAFSTKIWVAPLGAVALAVSAGLGSGRKLIFSRAVAALIAFAFGSVAAIAAVAVAWWSDGDLVDQVVGFRATATSQWTPVRDNAALLSHEPVAAVILVAGAAAAVVVFRRKAASDWLLLVWFAVTGTFLAVYGPLFDHHLVLAVPPAVLLVVRAAPKILPVRALKPTAGVAVLLAVLTSGWAAAHAPMRETSDTNPAVAALAKLPHDAVVVTDEQSLAVEAGRRVPGPLVDTSTVRLTSGDLSTQEVCRVALDHADAVLFNVGGRFKALPGLRACLGRAFREQILPNGARLLEKR